MQDYTRLFDVLHYQQANYPLEICLAEKVTEDGRKFYKTYSTNECIAFINQLSKALLKLGVKKDDKIGLISNNRPQWNFVDIATQQIGAIIVPLYPTISESEYTFIFNDAEIKYAFVADAELFNKVTNIKPNVPSLKDVYTFNEVPGAKNWKSLLEEVNAEDLKEIETLKASVKPDELATLIYTSGTTGNPKGVMLSHTNIISNIKSTLSIEEIMDTKKRCLSFLPMCHVFERMVVYTYMVVGMSVYYAESIETIGENLKEVKPHFFTAVPRLLEKVYEKIMEKGNALTGFRKTLFFWSIDLGLRYKINTNQGLWYNLQLAIARKLIFSKWKEALGGEVEALVSGAAALNAKLGTLFTAAGIPIIEGYGLTETSPVLTTNRLQEVNRKLGTVGLPLPGVEIKIADDGEILAKGPNIMMGYYKRPDLTAEVIDKDGWFHTGDIGEFDGKFLKITDRKKELFKTSGGKYVAPQPIENRMKESPLIEQVMVVGNNRKFVSGLIVPSFVNLEAWCKNNTIEYSGAQEIIKNPKVMEAIQKEVERINRNINHVEQIKKFTLLPVEWSPHTGELTPTLKLKRKVITEKFSREIEEMYKD
jgi:long-chain acyl-CoA synthetase